MAPRLSGDTTCIFGVVFFLFKSRLEMERQKKLKTKIGILILTLSYIIYLLVSVGSIPELPAESCKEIKASEGRQADSGKYWFDSIILGKVILAHCDMETEGETII